MELNINKEQLKGFGKVGLKIGKSIVVEGTKALALKGAAAVITTSFEEGFGGIKDIKLDDILEGKKKQKKKILSKTTIEEEVVEITEDETEVTN